MIANPIPVQNFEVVRDKIVSIIRDEYSSQFQKDNTLPAIQRIWRERFIPFDSNNEVPSINVNLARGEYTNQSVKKVDGTYTYNIDVYTNAPTDTDGTGGDERAMVDMIRVVGLIRAILTHPDYYILGLTPGIVRGSVKVERFFVAYKSEVRDALSDTIGRLIITVGAVESCAGLLDTGNPFDTNTTKSFLSDTNGFYLETDLTQL